MYDNCFQSQIHSFFKANRNYQEFVGTGYLILFLLFVNFSLIWLLQRKADFLFLSDISNNY